MTEKTEEKQIIIDRKKIDDASKIIGTIILIVEKKLDMTMGETILAIELAQASYIIAKAHAFGKLEEMIEELKKNE